MTTKPNKVENHPDLSLETPPPDTLTSLLFGTVTDPVLKLPILRAAIKLQVWAKIGEGYDTADEIAIAIGADPGGIRRLLDALVIMKLLEKKASAYSLPDWAEYYLLPGAPAYLGDFILEWLAWEKHGQLAESIRTGKRPVIPNVTQAESVSHFIPYYAVRAISPRRYIKRYDGYWESLEIEPRKGLQVLDLACGVGIATHALALKHPGIRVTLQDWPAMLEMAVDAARKLGDEAQITILPGDMLSVELGKEKFHVARLGFVTYFFGSDDLVGLFTRVHAALKPRGVLIVDAPLSDEEHCENEEAVVDGPWLYAVTAHGDVYSFLDYQGFLKKAGFTNIIHINENLIKAIR